MPLTVPARDGRSRRAMIRKTGTATRGNSLIMPPIIAMGYASSCLLSRKNMIDSARNRTASMSNLRMAWL